MSDREIDMIILVPNEPDVSVVAGSKVVRADCGCSCWASPNSLTLIGDATLSSTILTTCIDHAMKADAFRESVKEHGIFAVEGTRATLAATHGDAKAAALFDMLGVRERPIE